MMAETRFEQQLRRSAASLDLDPDPDRARRRAGQRARNRRTTGGLAVVAVLAAGAIGALLVQDGDTSLDVAGRDGSPLELSWSVIDGPAPHGFGAPVVASDDGGFYQLSTAPGPVAPDEEPTWAVYRSLDGTTWEWMEAGDRWLGDLAERDGSLYATEVDSGGLVSSHDGGGTWDPLPELPAPAPPPAPDGVVTGVEEVRATMTVADDVLVATRWARFGVDEAAIGAQLGLDADQRVLVDGDRYSVYDTGDGDLIIAEGEECGPSGDLPGVGDGVPSCTIGDVDPDLPRGRPIAELGIEGPVEVVEHFVSTDGLTWAGSDVPGNGLVALDGVLVASEKLPPWGGESLIVSLWRSTDGTDWTPLAVPDGLGVIEGRMGDQLIGSSRTVRPAGGSRIFVGDLDGAWVESDLATVVSGATIEAVAVSDLGVIVAARDDQDGRWILTSADGLDWSASTVADLGASSDSLDTPQVFAGPDQLGVTYLDHGNRGPEDGTTETVTLLATPER